jgi:pimeloyl-ACP methyl ester carboxylesterase
MMRLIALELAQNGFVVVPFDFRGHGQSGGNLSLSMTGFFGGNSPSSNSLDPLVNDVLAIKSYLASRGDVNMSNLGYIGYSMGGGPGFEILSHDNDFNAMVGIAPVPNADITNLTNPRNLLILVGGLDEAIPRSELEDVMANKTGVAASAVEMGHLYGNFASGTAAEMVVDPYTDHLTAPYDPHFSQLIVSWFLQALQGPSATPASFAYPVLVTAVFVAMGGALGLFWVVSGPILDRFARRKVEVPPSQPILEAVSTRNLVGRYFAYGLILSLPCIFCGAFLLLTPLTFTAFDFMFLAGPSVATLLLTWRTYSRQGLSFRQMYRANLATTSGRNLAVGAGLGIILYALLALTGNNLLGIVPGVFRWEWLPVYFVPIVFALINYMLFALPVFAEKFGRGHKYGLIKAAAINTILPIIIFGVMIVLFCLIAGSFFFYLVFPPTVAILFITYCTATYYYLRTNDAIMPAIATAVFWTFVLVTLSPYIML